ncbi:5348_t:CDS:2 [Dentiscutata erythropus]|uniref:5348_t:CDS:1 n=1 Tax=Dentiscutata erythropus TaxID=1348616 RepID=A0A9N9GIM8_9GLOM|nr:5348_t:CDS:2 [Dentiscutata erythropus]
MSNVKELGEHDEEYDQASMPFSLEFSDDINSIFIEDLCELNDDEMSLAEESVDDIGIESVFVAFLMC